MRLMTFGFRLTEGWMGARLVPIQKVKMLLAR